MNNKKYDLESAIALSIGNKAKTYADNNPDEIWVVSKLPSIIEKDGQGYFEREICCIEFGKLTHAEVYGPFEDYLNDLKKYGLDPHELRWEPM